MGLKLDITELYKKYNEDDLLSLFIHKWATRGFIAWILSAVIFQFNVIELAITLFIILGFNTWMIRAEWKRYKEYTNKYINKKHGKN